MALKACCCYNLLVYGHKESLALRTAAAAVAETCLGIHIVSASHKVHKPQHSGENNLTVYYHKWAAPCKKEVGDMGLIASNDVSITFLYKFWTALWWPNDGQVVLCGEEDHL